MHNVIIIFISVLRIYDFLGEISQHVFIYLLSVEKVDVW